jgi:hypothetical protein
VDDLFSTAPAHDSAFDSTAMPLTALTAAVVLGFGVAAYALAMYGFGPGAERLHPEMRAAFESHPIAIKHRHAGERP